MQLFARDYIITITLKIGQWYYSSLTVYAAYAIQKVEKRMTLWSYDFSTEVTEAFRAAQTMKYV